MSKSISYRLITSLLGITENVLSKILNNEFLDYETMEDFNLNEVGGMEADKVKYCALLLGINVEEIM